MKKRVCLLAMLMLAGCAGSQQGLRVNDLRDNDYLRAERTLPLRLAQIQQALFKHKATCGSAPEFAVDPANPSYATVTENLTAMPGWEHTVLVDLTVMLAGPIKARAYSYYAGTEKQIGQIFDAITKPTVCAGKSG